MKLATLAFLVTVVLAACDGGDPIGEQSGQGGFAVNTGSGGGGGTQIVDPHTGLPVGTGGAAGAQYVPDPAPTCPEPPQNGGAEMEACGSSTMPEYNSFGTQCMICFAPWDIPDPPLGCAVRIPTAISGGVVLHGPRDLYCVKNCTICAPKPN